MNDYVEIGKFYGKTVSDRKYKSGQGYGMTLTVKVHQLQPRPLEDHTLRVTVKQGYDDESARATVDRWNGEQWYQVVQLLAPEIGGADAPTYVCWDWTKESHPTALATREDCEQWLSATGRFALEQALEVLEQ